MSVPVKVLVNGFELTPPIATVDKAAEWNLTWEERIDGVGQASCQDAMTVERDYTRALASGKVPGNGGGAPVKIHGWICQGYDTPEVLATGRASACKKQGMQILAVLVLPSPSSSPSS